MRLTRAATLGTWTAATFILATLPAAAHANYGNGVYTFPEWINLNPGNTKSHIENDICNCSGLRVETGVNTVTIWYDNTTTNGHVSIVYFINTAGTRTALHTAWCNNTDAASCNQEF